MGKEDEYLEKDEKISPKNASGPKIDRRTTIKLLSAAGVTGITSLAGCAGNGDQTPEDTPTSDQTTSETDQPDGAEPTTEQTETPAAKLGGRLKAAWNTNEVPKLDPTKITAGSYFQLAANIFNGLVWLKKDLTIRGDLAKDWTVENDGKRFTFDLHEGVTFHNGDQFTADDVEYSIRRTIEQETVNASKLAQLKQIDNGGINVIDDYTVELNFQQPFAPALVYLTRGPGRAAAIVSKGAIEEMGAKKYLTQPVGTGPFQVADHQVGNLLKLDRYEGYFKTDENGTQLPYLDGVDVSFIPEPTTLVNALRGGDVQFANLIPRENLDTLKGSNGVNIRSAPGINWFGVCMNQAREPFGSQKVRLGIAKVIDNQALVDTAFFGHARISRGPLNAGTEWVWRDDKPDDQAYAPEDGKRMLEEEGAAGASFRLTTNPNGLREAKVLRNQLNNAGLNVELDQVPVSTFWERFGEEDYDMIQDGSVGDPDPDQSLYNFYRQADQGGVWNLYSYTSNSSLHAMEVNDLLGQQRRELDREARKQTLQKVEDLLIEDTVHVYLYHTDDVMATRSEVNGFDHIPYMRYFDKISLDE